MVGAYIFVGFVDVLYPMSRIAVQTHFGRADNDGIDKDDGGKRYERWEKDEQHVFWSTVVLIFRENIFST